MVNGCFVVVELMDGGGGAVAGGGVTGGGVTGGGGLDAVHLLPSQDSPVVQVTAGTDPPDAFLHWPSWYV